MIQACRTVGRPIFFSVMIILLSFVPVFALTGRDGKTFHPLAFTKSFAMIGVAIISITLVPALIPSFIKGRLRSEEESWLVRNLIGIYKPWLTWLMPRRNFAMWSFSALLIVGAGLFPLDAVLGIPWRTLLSDDGGRDDVLHHHFHRRLALAGLVVRHPGSLALTAYNFPKIGTDYMPPLDEGSILDMPVTVPRVSVTQATDDLKARDALMRRFPEVEMIVGKAGRADTPTDPSPLDMVESVITLRPKEYWPRRKLRYQDAQAQTAVVLAALQTKGRIEPIADEQERHAMLDAATMNATHRFDEAMRELATQRFAEFEARLGPKLLREFVAELVERWKTAGQLLGVVEQSDIEGLAAGLTKEFAPLLAAGPSQEDINRLIQQIAEKLAAEKKVELGPELMTAKLSAALRFLARADERLRHRTADVVHRDARVHRQAAEQPLARGCARWTTRSSTAPSVRMTGMRSKSSAKRPTKRGSGRQKAPSPRKPPLGGRGRSGTAIAARRTGRGLGAASVPLAKHDVLAEQAGRGHRPAQRTRQRRPHAGLGQYLDPADHQPHRHAGHRRATMIGVKVFGNDLDKIQDVSEQVAEVLKQIPGAVDVFPDQIRGKGYLEITIDREKAARYGVNVGDIQDVIETALGGKAITMTVEGRERYPVRIRYARAFREDEEDVKNLLVSATAPMGEAGGSGCRDGRRGADAAQRPPRRRGPARSRFRWPRWPT